MELVRIRFTLSGLFWQGLPFNHSFQVAALCSTPPFPISPVQYPNGYYTYTVAGSMDSRGLDAAPRECQVHISHADYLHS